MIRIRNILGTKIGSKNGKITKRPHSSFFVELEQGQNNKLIYKTKYLLHKKVIIEQPYTKREIAQRTRCQEAWTYNNYYYRIPKCRKYAEDHFTDKRMWKKKRLYVKCCNHEGNRPVS